MTPPPAVSYERLSGAALGCMCGDALGMPVEGWSAPAIEQAHGRLDRMVGGRLEAGSYTDDSQMMLGILETLSAKGGLDPAHLAGRFAANFEPHRGYGRRIHGVMERITAGRPWDQVGTDSFGNGGAMRVGVLGAYYADDDAAILRAALDQCRITHHHPRGLAGAAAQALAVGLAARLGAEDRPPDAAEFAQHIADQVRPIDGHTASRLDALTKMAPSGPDQAGEMLINEYACDVTAPESVPPALGAFLWSSSCEQAVVLAVSLGGDTDTIGAMAGAIAGAFWGVDSLPRAWTRELENGPQGRDYVLELCGRAIKLKTSLTN